MRVFSFEVGDEFRIGLEGEDGRAIDFSRAWPLYRFAVGGEALAVGFASLQDIIERGFFEMKTFNSVLSFVEKHDLWDELALKGRIRYAVPVARPSKILALGRNYAAHAAESNAPIPEEPIIFEKSTTSMIPHGANIVIPWWLNGRVDHEIELAVVMGKRGRYIPKEKAMSFVAGFTILNDVSARTMQAEDLGKSNPWLRSKSIDTFAPIGPAVVPRDCIEDPQNLEMVLRVNREERQRSNTSNMIFKIPEIIEYISKYMTLLPGDIISTGTPEGISPIVPGDVVEATIEGIGTLRNKVAKEKKDKKFHPGP
ncbi:MAG: fumarylacetoacetate hydrolase family protein [bacterium]